MLDQIEGWLLPTTALAMIEALWAQERRGYAGDIAEIGVWQGKSFLALAAGARPGERLVAIDPFDAGDPTAQRPDLDVTPYGAGYKGAFLANLSRFFPPSARKSSKHLRELWRTTDRPLGNYGFSRLTVAIRERKHSLISG